MKRVMSVLLIFVSLAMVMTACSSKEPDVKNVNESSNDILAKGRYVEEDVDLPSDVSDIVSLVVSPEGNIELYAYGDNGNFIKYQYIDRQWEKDETDPLIREVSTNSIQAEKVFYGENKRRYVLANLYPSFGVELHRLSDSGKLEKLDIKRFTDVIDEMDDVTYWPNDIDVLEDGTVAAIYYWNDIELYSPDGQTITGEFVCGYPSDMTAYGNSIYYVSDKQKEIVRTDTENYEEQTFAPFELELSETARVRYNGNISYICDTSGIHLHTDGSSIWETVVDGKQSSLGMPSLKLIDFLLGAEDDYYLVLEDMEKWLIKHIYYDDNQSILPVTELTIYSIENSNTIREAISIFQNNHPGCSINFRVANQNSEYSYIYGLKDPDATVTLQEQINALNTELLADKGADIIVLDSLPVDSYIEKGVLEDMGDIFNPMIENNELLSNIAEDYIKDGKVYTMPVRIRLPIIYGSSEAVEAAGSIKDLAAYAKSCKDMPLFDPSNYRAMTAWFLLLYQDQLLNDENEIDQALLLDILNDIKTIADNIEASENVELSLSNNNYENIIGYWVTGYSNVHRRLVKANITEAYGFNDLTLPIEAAGQWNGTIKAINNTYRASTMLGINSASKNKELAKEFIQYLFSEEIQATFLQDGFPVNKAAMEKLVEKDVEFAITTFKDDYIFVGHYPTPEIRKSIYEEIKALDRPMENDMMMIDMILDEAERYFRGDSSAEQAVENILGSINAYLSE